MKLKSGIIYSLLLFGMVVKAQIPMPPQTFNYQGIARNNLGTILPDQPISLRISILNNSSTGNTLYSETFNTATNQFGLFNLNIGLGNVVSGQFSAIDWATDSKWLQVEIDIEGGNNFILIGSSQLLSVPYALYAAKSKFTESQNINTSVSPLGDTLYIGNSYYIIPGVSLANACRTDIQDTISYTNNFPHAGDNPYNTTLYGFPKFILKDYIELDKIDSISRYRSGVGHDYSDYYETCRSLKHYYKPKYNVDWASVKIFSPVNGVVSSSTPEGIGGNQVWITPTGMPAFSIILFHVNLTTPLNVGSTVFAGQQLGTHTGSQTTSDIAIQINEPNGAWRRASYFDLMSDKLFDCYISHGIPSRDSLIIPKEARDNDPLLPCNGGQFFYSGTINNWVRVY